MKKILTVDFNWKLIEYSKKYEEKIYVVFLDIVVDKFCINIQKIKNSKIKWIIN